MIKTLTKYSFLLLAFFAINSCDIIDKIDNRELSEGHGIQSTFPFEFTIEASETLYWKSAANFYINLKNKNQVKGQLFHVSWELRDREGKLFFKGGEVHKFDIPKGKQTIQYVPLDKGEYNMVFFCTNGNKKYDVEQTLNFTVINRPFEASVTADRDTFYQSENEPIHLQVTVEDADWVQYQYSYVSAQENQLTTLDGAPIEEHKKYDLIENNEFLLRFDPAGKAGKHTLFFHFFDTQGQEIVEEITFTVEPIDFKLSLENLSGDIFFNETAQMRAELTPEFLSTPATKYTATYLIKGGDGIIEVEGKTYKNGESFAITKGTHDFSYTPTEYDSGSHEIQWTITDEYGNRGQASASVTINQRAFDFTATTDQQTLYLGNNEERGTINCSIQVTGDSKGIEYYLKAQSDGPGSFYYKGKEYANNEPIPVQVGTNFALEYEPTGRGTGSHKITLTVSDNTGQKKTQTLTFAIYQKPTVKKGTVRTWYFSDNKGGCWNGCDYDHHYMIDFSPTINPGSTIEYVKVVIRNHKSGKNEIHKKKYSEMNERDGFKEFFVLFDKEPSKAPVYDHQTFELHLIDSKKIESIVYSGLFTEEKDDNL